MTTTRTKTEPPAAAVAADAHWAAKMARLRERQLATTTFVICDDQTVRDRYLRAQRAHEMAQTYLTGNPTDADAKRDLATAATELAAAQAAYDDISISVRFRALPRQVLEDLYKEHPPSEADAEEGATWSASFPAALISAASVDGMSEQEAQELLDTWSLAESNAMFNAAYGVQNTTRADLGKG